MRLIDYFDRGADLFPQRHCLHDGTRGWTYADVRGTTHEVANGLLAPGLGRATRSRSTVPTMRGLCGPAGHLRAGLIWAPVNARNAIEENLYILDNTDVAFLFYHSSFDALSAAHQARPARRSETFVCIDEPEFEAWLAKQGDTRARSARCARRGGDPDQLGRHHRPAQGRADHQPQ